jgi:hypothetical protein
LNLFLALEYVLNLKENLSFSWFEEDLALAFNT